ncbi:hypothetical protein F5B21DRAFT_464375 [Xylaria acuta]|nr:hypothetical protein F5B21DRAFT_464375 [Xylaria acuta]
MSRCTPGTSVSRYFGYTNKLFAASSRRWSLGVRFILENRANVDQNRSPLYVAASERYIEVVKFLFEKEQI